MGFNDHMRLRVIDLETTGSLPDTAEIIEFGAVDVVQTPGGWHVETPHTQLLRPLGPLTPETQAIHHLTASDFSANDPVATPEILRALIWAAPQPDMLVAHHIAFEQHFLGLELTDSLPWLCTLKIAKRLWPDAPRHTNQVLRYWLNLDLAPDLAMPPHRAGPDAYVTAHILMRQLGLASLEDMRAWSATKSVRRGAALRAGRKMAQG